MNNTSYFLLGLLVEVPSVLIALICILIAAIRWRRHPEVSLLTILSLGWLTLQSLIFEAIFFFAPEWFIGQGKIGSLETFYTVMDVFYNFLTALALGLLLTAIFIRREPTPRRV